MANTSSTYDMHKNGVWSCMKRNPAPYAWKYDFTGMHAYLQQTAVRFYRWGGMRAAATYIVT